MSEKEPRSGAPPTGEEEISPWLERLYVGIFFGLVAGVVVGLLVGALGGLISGLSKGLVAGLIVAGAWIGLDCYRSKSPEQ